MLRDKLEKEEQYRLLAGVVLLAAATFGAGYALGGGMIGDTQASASEAELQQTVQQLTAQQLQAQRQQLRLVANQTENVSADDLSIDASVSEATPSQFGQLYKVTISYTGTVPSRTGGLQPLQEQQSLFISPDGRYVFSQPTDLQQAQQQQPTLQ